MVNIRQNSRAARCTRVLWIINSLPNYVVDVFKVHLDQFWAQQEVMFDWTADLTGTGDRSEYTVESN